MQTLLEEANEGFAHLLACRDQPHPLIIPTELDFQRKCDCAPKKGYDLFASKDQEQK